jgi:hypothetical protein
MKKFLICLLAICLGISLSAFTPVNNVKEKAKVKSGTYLWWDFNGGLLQQWDPTYYTVDGNQWPECYYPLGLIYCEIKALPLEFEPNLPDLSTIISVRYRPLL